MNIGLVGGIATIVSMIAFLAAVIWAMNARRRKDFERTALVGNVEIVARVIQVQARSAVLVGRSQDAKNRQLQEVGLTHALRRRGNVAAVDERIIGDAEIVRLQRGETQIPAERVVDCGGHARPRIRAIDAVKLTVIFERLVPAREVVEDVTVFRIILGLEVLVD